MFEVRTSQFHLFNLLQNAFLDQTDFLCWNISKRSKICRLLHGCDFVARANVYHSLPRSLIHHSTITQWTSTRTIIIVAPTAGAMCRLRTLQMVERETREDCKKKKKRETGSKNRQKLSKFWEHFNWKQLCLPLGCGGLKGLVFSFG